MITLKDKPDFTELQGDKYDYCTICGPEKLRAVIHFDSGSTEPAVGETVTGATSSDTGVVEFVQKTSGVWSSTNLVTNGTFASSTGWILGTGWTISGGVATQSAPESYGTLSQHIASVAGRTYRVTYTTSSVVHGGNLYISIGDATELATLGTSQTVDLTPTICGDLVVSMNDELKCSFDNIIVNDLTGDAAGVIVVTSPTGYDQYNLVIFSDDENLNGSTAGSNFATVNGICGINKNGRIYPTQDLVEYRGQKYCRDHFQWRFAAEWRDEQDINITENERGKV